MLDVRAPDVLVGVEDVDVAGAARVGLARDRADERRVLDQRVDAQDLAGLQVHADPDREACIAFEALFGVRHGGEL